MEFCKGYLSETSEIVSSLNVKDIWRLVREIESVRSASGRIFFLGVGGSSANCSHAVNDFRKICGIECYAPTDNVSELTAICNDDGWENVFVNWLKESQLDCMDSIFILSVGGGNVEKNISVNLVRAIEYAKTCGARVLGVVGRGDGYTAKHADACVVVPVVDQNRVTPHAEEIQGVIVHLLVSHPNLKNHQTKWESTDETK